MFHVDAERNVAVLRYNKDALDYTHLFEIKQNAHLEQLSVVKLFAKDPYRDPVIVAFGVKPDGIGKFYLYTNGRLYDETKQKNAKKPFGIGNLKWFSSIICGSSRLVITGGVKEG
jgi:hypothetical protein